MIDLLILLNGSVWSIPFEDRRMRLLQRTLLHPIGGPLVMNMGLSISVALLHCYKVFGDKRLPQKRSRRFGRLCVISAAIDCMRA